MRYALFLLAVTLSAQAPPPAPSVKIADADIAKLREAVKPLTAKVAALRKHALVADVEIYEKAVQALLSHPEEFYAAEYLKHAHDAIEKGMARAAALEKGTSSWTRQKGRIARGYRSRIDDSVQPYRLSIPAQYDPAKPARLDVVLHGRDARLTEARFLAVADSAKPLPDTQTWIELEVMGRGNNAYRWAGETDVMEALASVRKQYNIDADRILLRGFSMGGAGTWHIGLHYPSLWAGIEAGAGFTETIRYAKVANPKPWERDAMRIYDAVDYAPNTMNVPTVGYGGEIDPQLQASKNIQEALEGLALKPNAIFLIGPQTPHRWHPDKKAESEVFLTKNLPRRMPEPFPFVTFTPRYGAIWNWHIAALDKTYARAELSGTRTNVRTSNIAELELDAPATVTIDGQSLTGQAFVKEMNRWSVRKSKPMLRKRAGLQGPIDDAFMDRFLVVSDAPSKRLDTFAANWDKFFRGSLRRKASKDVSKADMADSHLILFGTPAGNKLIAKIVKLLPVRWTESEIQIKGQTFDARTHTLALIQPNPLQPSKYVVLNSGHTFSRADLEGTNALLYPRLGDWAVIETATGKTAAAGFFDENWR
jgi:dienelactone hydrolase